MLVLTRKTNQSIMIGDDVEVSVLAVSRDKIRLGITAPREVPVFRKEVYLSMQGERAEDDDAGQPRERVRHGLRRARRAGPERSRNLCPAGRPIGSPLAINRRTSCQSCA